MKTIQQFYSDNRYLNLAGNNYGKEISTYTPEEVRNTEFDLSIAETLSTPALRMASNEFLMELFRSGKLLQAIHQSQAESTQQNTAPQI